LFEAIGWCEQTVETPAAAEAARFPRLHAAAGYGCFTGRGEIALAHARRACELEADPRYEAFEPGLATFIQALAQVYTGHLDRYVELARQVAALPGSARAYGIPLLVDGLQAIDQVDEAIDLADQGVEAARALGNPFWIAYSLWAYGAAFAKADPPAALTAWREALEYVQREPVHFFLGFIARDAARLQTVEADPDETLAMLEAAVDSFHQSGNVAQLTITLATAPSMFHRVGHSDIAATMLAAITQQPAALHHAPDLADLAGTLRARLDQERFDECASAGTPMDLNELARYTLRTIRNTRAQLAERAHDRPLRPAGLSKREVEVLRLVADGLSAREIGERLYISARTAEHHIQHVYTKTGVNGRVAVARWAAEHLR
jgi:DNA-binding CsgD family transcriptional regulator